MKKVEILAPAGSIDGLKAAISGGCDAVYIGGSRFGARAYAKNPDREKLIYAIDLAHLYGKKIYLTVNTLIKDREIDELFAYISPYYEAGLDAVIVQDIGAMEWIHCNFPDLPIHASTQMTLTSALGAELLRPLGVTRFVPARELGMEEIKKMRKETSLEIEIFVHGALCYCYSGQCLLSSMIGGRSGNRGRCAQPCRMPYTLESSKNKQKGYFLSPKDMCTLDILGEILKTGVNSLKIEGRMKGEEYAALTSFLYGKYAGLYFELGRDGYQRYIKDHKKEFEYDKMALMDLYNRGGFSSGYFKNPHGKTMMSMKRPNHFGVLVGKTIEVKKNQAKIQLLEEVHSHDVLEFRNEQEEALYDYTTGSSLKKGSLAIAKLMPLSGVKKGDLVYRTKNQKLIHWIQEEILNKEKKIPLKGELTLETGRPARLVLKTDDTFVTVEGQAVEKAIKSPLTWEQAAAAIDKIQDTLYSFKELKGQISRDAFLPVKALKELRRAALLKLGEESLKAYRRERRTPVEPEYLKDGEGSSCEPMEIQASVWTRAQFQRVLQKEEVSRIYVGAEHFSLEAVKGMLEEAHIKNKELYIAMPYIFRNRGMEGFSAYLLKEADGYLVRNFEGAAYLKERTEKPFLMDTGMYTFNRYAKTYWKRTGAEDVTVPVELNGKELKIRGIQGDILLAYGHIPLMITAQCMVDNSQSCEKKSSIYFLSDRKGKELFGENICKFCYNVIYDGTACSLLPEAKSIKSLFPKGIRMDFTVEDEQAVELILKNYINVFRYNKEEAKEDKVLYTGNTGHFRKGVE